MINCQNYNKLVNLIEQYPSGKFSRALIKNIDLYTWVKEQRKYNNSSIISYCDLRWNTGNLYEQIGFVFTHQSKPDYWYKGNNIIGLAHRTKYQKHKLSKLLDIFGSNISEWKNIINNNYDRIWDCGNLVFVKNL